MDLMQDQVDLGLIKNVSSILNCLKQAVLYFSEAIVGSSNVLKFTLTSLNRK